MQHFDQDEPPPQNAMSHPGIVAVDITGVFAAAVNTLSPGEIVKDEHFELFESVSALEVMDRKMDSGLLDEGESLDEEYDVTRELLPDEILGIIDQLLCLEMAWHQGYPLSQTILTSVYIEALMNPRPDTLDDVNFTRHSTPPPKESSLLFALRAYCAGLVKACSFVNDTIREETYYEEEDFVTNTYDRDLLCQIPVEAIKDLISDALEQLQAVQALTEIQSTENAQDICQALGSRLRLRLAFLDAVDIPTTLQDLSGNAKLPWEQLRTLIDEIERQHGLGKQVPEAFSTKLQRRLASTMPPRPMVTLSFEETIADFKRFFQNGNEAIDILQYTDPQSLLNYILLYQAQKPQPQIFIRTILQNLLFRDMIVLGRFSIRQLLDHDVSLCVLPCGPHFDRSFDDIEVPTDPRHQVASAMESFRQRIADVYLDTLRILCQNRCRARRLLCHHIQEWDIMETDVGEIEERLQGQLHDVSQGAYQDVGSTFLPLSSWVYLYKLRQMEWVVQLGFELRIYQPDELMGMYYYLKRLASQRAEHIDSVKQTTILREERARQHLKLKNDDPLPEDIDHEFKRSLQHLRISMLDAACTWEFADGLSLLYLAILRLGLLKPPPRPYSTDALRYELRMRPFARVAFPSCPSYEEFKQETEMAEVATTDVLRAAEAGIGAARKGFEAVVRLNDVEEVFSINDTAHKRWIDGAKNCLRATIAAGVAVSTLKRAYEKLKEKETAASGESRGEEEKKAAEQLKLKVVVPEPGEGYHDWWVVPKLSQIK
ncbi:Mak10-domain-containing protein [Astrocystis sublimbata]|nr:Mak10-domain-containing protein [Astrocystis sublimbata]